LFSCSTRPELLFKYNGLVQSAVAAVNALENPLAAHWERLLSMEKIFLLSLGEEEAVSAVRQFCDLLSQKKQKQDRDLSFCDLLLLTVFAYSLAEGGQWKDVDDQQLRV
jgi:hypothetical protein